MARRFLPVILPGALLFASAAALAGAHSGSRLTRAAARQPRRACSSCCSALQYARVARPLLGHVEYAGIIPKIEQIAASIQDTDLLIVESRDALRHARPGPAARLHLRRATSSCCARACPTSRRSRRSSTGPGSATRASCSWVAAARSCCRDAGTCGPWPASASRCPSTRRAATRIRERSGGRSSTTASTSSCRHSPGAPGRDRDRRRHRGRPARAPLPRQGDDQRPLVPMVARRLVRLARRRCRRVAARSTLWMDDGGRPAAVPPRGGHGVAAARVPGRQAAERRPRPRHGGGDVRLQAVRRSRFLRTSRRSRPPMASPSASN